MNTVGIDPGITGALALFDDGAVQEVVDMPTLPRHIGKGKTVNAFLLAKQLNAWGTDEVFLEYVNAMPPSPKRRAGTTSSFNFGHTAGVIEGVLGSMAIPYRFVTPGEWKKHFRLTGKDKDAARALCIQRYPHLADHLARKMDCGRADAILIAQFGLEEVFI